MAGVGRGSWERSNTKRKVEHALALEMRRCREMLLAPCSGKLFHRSRGGGLSVIDVNVEWKDERRIVTLNYYDRLGEQVQVSILLQSTPAHFGGLRWWFTCPLVKGEIACNRRVANLYLPPGERYFGCRTCHQLTYHSSQTAHMLERYCNPEARRKRWQAALQAEKRAREAFERTWPNEREWLASLTGDNQPSTGPPSL